MIAFWTSLLATTAMTPLNLAVAAPPASPTGETADSAAITADTTTTTADEF